MTYAIERGRLVLDYSNDSEDDLALGFAAMIHA